MELGLSYQAGFLFLKTVVNARLIIIMILMIDDGMKFAEVSIYDFSVRN